MQAWFGVAGALFLGIALAACAGLRAWLPLLLTGILVKLGWLHVGTSFQFIGSTPALIAFGIATIVEIAGDKIPAVDHALDAASTVMRPIAGALLAASAFGTLGGPLADPIYATGLGIVVGAPTAMIPHMAKTGARLVSTATTGGVANPFLSVLEDCLALLSFIVAVVLPILVCIAVVALAFVVYSLNRNQRTIHQRSDFDA